QQMKVVKKLKTEAKPDGSAYAAPFHKLYVSDERGKAEAVVDVTKDEIVKTLHFESETGMPQYDPVARKVYVNLQDQDIFAVIDPATDTVVGRYPVGKCKGNHGMALDPEHHRAFLACEGNELMAVFDLDKKSAIAFLPLPGGPDVIKFDPGLRRIYVACYSGGDCRLPPGRRRPLPEARRLSCAARSAHRRGGFENAQALYAGRGRGRQARRADGGL